jgi:CRISPR-associated protein Csd2
MSQRDYVSEPVEHRYDFVLLFDVQDGNPNGDPDAGNLPRTDPLTQQGLVTDVCLKRKVRDYVVLRKAGERGYELFVEHRGILAHKQRRAIAEAQGKSEDEAEPSDKAVEKGKHKACELYFDVRTFGAVMSTGKAPKKGEENQQESKKRRGGDRQPMWNCGQVRGPVQLTFARSLHKISPMDNGITRVALTNAGDVRGGQEDEEEARSGQMGRKFTVSYGLYRAFGFVNPTLAKDKHGLTGFSAADLDLIWESLASMFDQDRSAARGLMGCVDLFVFEHATKLGNYHADRLFQWIRVEDNPQAPWVGEYPTQRSCYRITVDDRPVPPGIAVWRWDFDKNGLTFVKEGLNGRV